MSALNKMCRHCRCYTYKLYIRKQPRKKEIKYIFIFCISFLFKKKKTNLSSENYHSFPFLIIQIIAYFDKNVVSYNIMTSPSLSLFHARSLAQRQLAAYLILMSYLYIVCVCVCWFQLLTLFVHVIFRFCCICKNINVCE